MKRTRTQITSSVIDISSDSDISQGKSEVSDSDDDYKPEGKTKNIGKVKRAPLKHKTASLLNENGSKDSSKVATRTKKLPPKASKKRARKAEEGPSLEEKAPKKAKTSVSTKQKNDNDPLTSKAKKDQSVQMEWKEHEYLADIEGIDERIAAAIIKLFDEDNTIPFIARYRKELTGDMPPEKIRHVKDSYDSIKTIKHKAAVVAKGIEKAGKLTPQLQHSIRCARDLHELDHIYAPFKPGTKRELAARARMVGLEPAALTILEGTEELHLDTLIDKNTKGRETLDQVQTGIQHILADVISKDTDVLALIRTLLKTVPIRVESKRARRSKTNDSKKSSKDGADAEIVQSKFSDYFNFSVLVKTIKPHQVLALNRGEKLKELSTHINIPKSVEWEIVKLCEKKWFQRGIIYPLRMRILKESVKDSYARQITSLITRQIRSEMDKEAERESIEVFARNLKNLLLTPPHKGHPVLAIDPGFRHGCKTALVSSTGSLLEYCVMNFNSNSSSKDFKRDDFLKEIMLKHNCELIAIGNGQGCRETEQYISSLIKKGFFHPLDVQYTIVDEQGVSIYSCSEEAAKEFPNLDPTVRSAIYFAEAMIATAKEAAAGEATVCVRPTLSDYGQLLLACPDWFMVSRDPYYPTKTIICSGISVSIARRLQDPMSEMVKVEPKHLGVGMYQHDLPAKVLFSTLEDVVVECVSFVGVDLNTAPHCLLKQIAGLGTVLANRILEWREKNGFFFTRGQLNEVKGIGKKTFEQCAGFVRVLPDTISPSDRWKLCPLDRTWIHPESYPFANKFLLDNDINVDDLGNHQFREQVERAVSKAGGHKNIGLHYKITESEADLVIRGLLAPLNHDFRSQFKKPIFRKEVNTLSDLKEGTVVTGRVKNTTSFGAFVDIGVGRDGLIHVSGMKGQLLQLGDHVEVTVKNLDLSRGRIGLTLINKL